MEATCRQLMLFTEASLNDPVKTCPKQENKQGLKEQEAACGSRCSESSAKFDPLSWLLKTCVERLILPSIPCKPEWRQKTTRSGRSSYLQLHLARPTKGNACSSSESGTMWPTPSTRDYKGANGPAHFAVKERPHMSQLPNAVKVVEDSGLLPPAQSGAG